MSNEIYCAAMMDAETGGNKTYKFDAHADLMVHRICELFHVTELP